MSTECIVSYCKIDKIREHPNTQKLEICEVLGWQTIVPKGLWKEGQECVYFPPDCLFNNTSWTKINTEDKNPWPDRFGIRQYLKGKEQNRVSSVTLRGEVSHGFIVEIPEELKRAWDEQTRRFYDYGLIEEPRIGSNVAAFFKCIKYEPPQKEGTNIKISNQEKQHPLWQRYTDIENLRNYPDILQEGEEVWVGEKVHGQNMIYGKVDSKDQLGNPIKKLIASSHDTMKKRPSLQLWAGNQKLEFGQLLQLPNTQEELDKKDRFWNFGTLSGVQELLSELETLYPSCFRILIYGECYGRSVQTLDYNIPKGQFGYIVFDILVDDNYLEKELVIKLCEKHNVAHDNILYNGPFSIEKIRELSKGSTTMNEASHIREGVVVRPVKERHDPKIGRVILKYINDQYLASKTHTEEDTTDV